MRLISGDPVKDFEYYDMECTEREKMSCFCTDCGEIVDPEVCFCFEGKYVCDDCMGLYVRGMWDE